MIEYILLGLLIVLMLVVIIKLNKIESVDNSEISEELSEFKNQVTQEISSNLAKNNAENLRDMSDLKDKLNLTLNIFKNESNKSISELVASVNLFKDETNKSLYEISNNLNERLDASLSKTNKSFENLIVRMAKIDEAQKNIDGLGKNIVSLQDILTDKKTRGNFGEVQLYNILATVFGEGNSKIYETQFTLSNGTIADSVLHLPSPTGNICIDSKFPLENYQRSIDVNSSDFERKEAVKVFKQNLKKHINDISSKYIIANETSDQAIMFIPAEAIFAEINAYYQDIIDYAYCKKVWIASPTTLMAILNTTQIVLMNIEREKYSTIIQEELSKLSLEFQRYRKRWDSLSKNIDRVSKDVKDINVTSEKIEKKFDSISNVKIENRDDDVKLR